MKSHILLKITAIVFLLYMNGFTVAQMSVVHYQAFENGKKNENREIIMNYSNGITYLSDASDRIQYFIDYNRRENCTILESSGKRYKTITSFDSLVMPVFTEKKDTILGFECKHATFSYFSNTIDVFYTENANVYGVPYRNFIPTDHALALKIITNGNRVLVADKIEHDVNASGLNYPYASATTITVPELEELKIRSRYETLSVFREEQINFDTSLPKPEVKDTVDEVVYRLSNGTVILKKIKLPEIVRKGAYVFLELDCRSNGDAYDRTGSVFSILPVKDRTMLDGLRDSIAVVPSFTDNQGKEYQGFRLEPDFAPALELMRFFTSFGVDYFNDKRVINNYPWFDKAKYKQDITSLIPDDCLELWIGVFIGNYHNGGHIINLDLNFYPPDEMETHSSKWILPLFNTVNIMEMSGQNYPRLFGNDTLEIWFEKPSDVSDLQLLYTVTGHGGWGNGDEFNPRINKIFLDDELVFKVIPWRTDCATFRLYNPASGNFENGLSSSDFSRSNWCPGTATDPYLVPLPELSPGKHRMRIVIDQGPDEGSSFNAWAISGTLTGNQNQ